MDEMLEQLKALTSLDELGGMVEQLGGIWQGFVADRDEKIKGLDDAVAERDETIKSLQAENYRLITALGAAQEDNEPNPELNADGETEEEELQPIEDFIIDRDEE